jgi:hypothetical protein
MVGGLALSQLLTLYTTPVVYLYLARLQAWLDARREKDLMESTDNVSQLPLRDVHANISR